ncbi:MAG: hypothetical protein WC489_07300 [Patescibacteria group bacterium]|jgi:hypothetical protein|nr:hypothetical protein [Methanoregulaceae archaeon]
MPVEMSQEQYEQYLREQEKEEIIDEESRSPRRTYPSLGKPFSDRHLEKLLDPDVPRNETLENLWLFGDYASRHLELTIIPDRESHHGLRQKMRDLQRISTWDADDYLQLRQALVFASEVLAGKSIGYTDNTRERDALNEDRRVVTVKDDRTPQPKEGGFFSGIIGRRR